MFGNGNGCQSQSKILLSLIIALELRLDNCGCLKLITSALGRYKISVTARGSKMFMSVFFDFKITINLIKVKFSIGPGGGGR